MKLEVNKYIKQNIITLVTKLLCTKCMKNDRHVPIVVKVASKDNQIKWEGV